MGVYRDRGDSLDRERPRRHRAPQPGGVRQHPAPDTGVDMAAHPARRGRGGDLGHRVHDPVRVRRRRGHHEHGAVVDRGRHRGRIRPEVQAHWHHDRFHSEVVLGLAERGVHGRRHHHRRPFDVGPAVPRALHRQQHRLRATRRHAAHGGRRRVEQVAGEADQVVLHRQQRREGGRVEAVRAGVRRDRLAADPVDVRKPRVVDVGERPATVHRQVGGLHLTQPGQGVGHRSTSSASSE